MSVSKFLLAKDVLVSNIDVGSVTVFIVNVSVGRNIFKDRC